MITKKLLADYKSIKKSCDCLIQELRMMKTTDYGYGNDVIFNYKDGYPKPETVVGFDYERYDAKRRTLDKKREQLREVEIWIGDIEDDQTRLVFYYFYIEDLKWVKIAEKLGYAGNEDYPRVCIRDAYLKKMEIQ